VVLNPLPPHTHPLCPLPSVLIYSQFTKTLDILEDWLAMRRWGYQRIDGAAARGGLSGAV
jgi:SNF2 family DNA or RNA helicase